MSPENKGNNSTEVVAENSPELAWLLGVMCSGGGINQIRDRVWLSTEHPGFVQKIRSATSKCFQSDIDVYNFTYSTAREKDKRGFRVYLPQTERLKSLHSSGWPTVLREKYPWVYTSPEALWQFVTGYFDYKGWLLNPVDHRNHKTNMLILPCTSSKSREEIYQMLLLLGLNKARQLDPKLGPKRVNTLAVGVFDFDQIVEFANHVSSSVPDKENKLESFRQEKLSTTQEEDIKIPGQSEDLAWIIGILSARGVVSSRSNFFNIQDQDEELIEEFRKAGEKVFGLVGFKRKVEKKHYTNGSHQVIFYSKTVVDHLGDLRSTEWADTVLDKHYWIFKNNDFAKAFLTGFFDANGSVIDNGKNAQVVLRTGHQKAAEALTNILTALGIESDILHQKGNGEKKLCGVAIQKPAEIEKFVSLITSKIPSKETLLKTLRKVVSMPSQLEPEATSYLQAEADLLQKDIPAFEEVHSDSFIARVKITLDKIRVWIQKMYVVLSQKIENRFSGKKPRQS